MAISSNCFKFICCIGIIIVVVVLVCFGVWFSAEYYDCGEVNPENDVASNLTTNLIIGSHNSGDDSRPDKFKCSSGNYISLDKACDGQSDCDDQSDETLEECLSLKCSEYAFQCGYGACIEMSKICNTVDDCRDGSDETSGLCESPHTNSELENPNSSYGKFKCTSGYYISVDRVCNGRSDCDDQSDETLEKCSENKCPKYLFQCDYGACTPMFNKCNGVNDCRDGSDESRGLCGEKSGPSTISQGCKAPNIQNAVLKYDHNKRLIMSEETVMNGTTMLYYCLSGYIRDGESSNYCNGSIWQNALHSNCFKSCPKDKLKGVTFTAACKMGNTSVACNDQIKPGTIAKITCQERYKKLDHNSKDLLVCQDDGTWDYNPVACEAVCGEELLLVTPFSADNRDGNITYVPWHAGIYRNFNKTKFEYICGATIVSAKVLITAAHCFWNRNNGTIIDKSYYNVAAGKYYRDFDEHEPHAVFNNISELIIPENFRGDANNYESDIAIVVLENFLHFNSFIGPACIQWQHGAAKTISSEVLGRIASWGEDGSGDISKGLQTLNVQSSSYADCKKEAGKEFADAVPANKFCVLNKVDSIVCIGSGGSGFIEKNSLNEKNINNLWGVVSGGVPSRSKCLDYKFTTYTNIQYFEHEITKLITAHQPY